MQFLWDHHRYRRCQPLERDGATELSEKSYRTIAFVKSLNLWQLSITAVLLLLSFFMGASWSQYQCQISSPEGIDLKLHPQTFQYNVTFGDAPSRFSDSAWSSMFPDQGGFFRHPMIAPQRSTFAVFHQLHCLDSIRRGYWGLIEQLLQSDGKEKNIKFDPFEDLPFMTSPPHVSHCIDLIRNVLICRPDTTIEIKDEKIGGVTGFGTEHQCVDWKHLVEWVSRWETYLQQPKTTEAGG